MIDYMATEFGKRRAEILTFLKGLSAREKLVVLSFLSNDAMICTRVPNLALAILDMHRSYHKLELRQLVESEHSNLNLAFLARRKGCRLERIGSQGDSWRILRAGHVPVRLSMGEHDLERNTFTPKQALDVLRSLPDQVNSVRNYVPIEG
jgi:hypothetical protein